MASARPNWQYNDAGILRKKEDEDELLVFGYSCKLFRDDEKALFIDQGKHLIPWMGDETLKIDRYDGRGALYDLKQCEALPGGHDENRWVGLSDSERRVEQLCDEERYRALHHNEEEEALYQEEELKRLHKALGAKTYGEVAFNYDDSNGKMDDKGEGNMTEEEEGGDEAFVPPPELDIPINMVLPETVKLNAIMEKTALFISQQGAQMEILLKMKQAGNPQFQFLAFDSVLHPYYRHLLMAIKTGRYHPRSQNREKEESAEDVGDDHYLHPSLAPAGSRLELAPSIPSINYKPSADCAYSMLVNKIKDKQAAFILQPPGTTEQPVGAPTYYQEPQVVESSPVIAAPPVRYDRKSETEATTITASAVIYSKAQPQVAPTVAVVQGPLPVAEAVKECSEDDVSMKVDCPSGGSSVSSRCESPAMVTPPPDMQLIIDKMASYVAKNGRDFEAIVRSKGDNRFAFLDESHAFHSYYRHKIIVYERLEPPAPGTDPNPSPSAVEKPAEEVEERPESSGEDSQEATQSGAEDDRDDKDRSKTKPAPVCFSIKKPKESEALLEKRSALPIEESTDEEDGGQEGGGGEKDSKSKTDDRKKAAAADTKAKEEVIRREETEVIDLTDDHGAGHTEEPVKEKKTVDKAKWAEERVKDKLVAAAREKVAAAAREKQLQLERKRRAAAFLTMIRKEHPLQAPAPPVIGPQLPDGEPVLRMSADEGDVSSIPSPNSSDVPSPPHIGSQELQDRLSPKQNGDSKPSSLYARIQASKQTGKRVAASGSSSGEDVGHARSKSTSTNKRLHKHKRKKMSSHRRERSQSPTHRHRHKREEHPKLKKLKRSRSRSKSHHTKSSRHHHHHQQQHSTERRSRPAIVVNVRKEKHKKKKKSSKRKLSNSSDDS